MRARRWFLPSLVVAFVLMPTAASAHPLGNFTVNVYGGLVVRPHEVMLDYVVDLAEIPAFQERGRIDADGDDRISPPESAAYRAAECERLLDGVALTVDGVSARLRPRSTTLAFPPGQGGLSTLRLTCLSAAPVADAGAHMLVFADRNHAGRVGWREVTAVADGTTIVGSDVPAVSVTDRLRSYPKDALPLDVRTASVAFEPGGPTFPGPVGERSGAPVDRAADGRGLLANLAATPDPSVGFVGLMLLAAAGVGAVHAVGPGHGKSLIGAYLIGGGGTIRQAVAVGAAVSVMHTASVLALGVVILSLERAFAPERVYPWLGMASGLVALALGAILLVSRIHRLSDRRAHPDHNHEVPGRPLSLGTLLALAFSGGILPSPSALVVLLACISLGRTALGLALIAAFSLGLAASLVGVGAFALRARAYGASRLSQRAAALAPVGSAAAIALVGVVLTARGMIQL